MTSKSAVLVIQLGCRAATGKAIQPVSQYLGWNIIKPKQQNLVLEYTDHPVQFERVTLQDEAGGDWFAAEDGAFEAPRRGYYLLTVSIKFEKIALVTHYVLVFNQKRAP